MGRRSEAQVELRTGAQNGPKGESYLGRLVNLGAACGSEVFSRVRPQGKGPCLRRCLRGSDRAGAPGPLSGAGDIVFLSRPTYYLNSNAEKAFLKFFFLPHLCFSEYIFW